jgi:hypothetical protein
MQLQKAYNDETTMTMRARERERERERENTYAVI